MCTEVGFLYGLLRHARGISNRVSIPCLSMRFSWPILIKVIDTLRCRLKFPPSLLVYHTIIYIYIYIYTYKFWVGATVRGYTWLLRQFVLFGLTRHFLSAHSKFHVVLRLKIIMIKHRLPVFGNSTYFEIYAFCGRAIMFVLQVCVAALSCTAKIWVSATHVITGVAGAWRHRCAPCGQSGADSTSTDMPSVSD